MIVLTGAVRAMKTPIAVVRTAVVRAAKAAVAAVAFAFGV